MGICCTNSFLNIHHCRLPSLHLREIHGTKLQPLISMSLSCKPKRPSHLLGTIFKCSHDRKCSHIQRKRTSISTVRASSSADSPSSSSDINLIFVSSAITATLAIANRVLYKLALVPMKQYPFFLAQLTTFGYVIIYFSILYIRYRAGIVTDEMLALPKSRFLAIGILEALGVATGMASAGAISTYFGCPFADTPSQRKDVVLAMLPGPAIPILSQSFLVWQLTFSVLLFGRKYSINQLAGCLLVAIGVILAVVSGSNAGQMVSEVELFWPALMIVSSAFQAGASVIKESVFIDSTVLLKGKSVDLFVVNSFGSGFQALFVFLLLPFLSKLKGIPFSELPSYFRSGAGCFLHINNGAAGCDGAPLLPLLYMIINLGFNIAVLNVVKITSAVVSSLTVTLAVPISIYILSRPLPYLPEGASLSPFFLLGSAMLVIGLALYNIPVRTRQGSKVD